MTKEKVSTKKHITTIIIAVVIYMLFNELIWEKYIYTPTAWDAVEDQTSESGTMYEIDSDNKIVVLPTHENTFQLYTVSKGFLGWKIQDEVDMPIDEDEPYAVDRMNLTLKKNNDVEVLVVITVDPDIGYVRTVDQDGNEIDFNGTANDDAYLHYIYDEDGFDEDLTFEMYSYEDELLYTE